MLRALICAACLAGCSQIEPVAVIPGELLRPVPEPRQVIVTERDVALWAIATVAALREANARLVAIAEIVGAE